jgi:hypothetical protein
MPATEPAASAAADNDLPTLEDVIKGFILPSAGEVFRQTLAKFLLSMHLSMCHKCSHIVLQHEWYTGAPA